MCEMTVQNPFYKVMTVTEYLLRKGIGSTFVFYFHYSSSKQSACVDWFSGLHRLDGCLVPLALQ